MMRKARKTGKTGGRSEGGNCFRPGNSASLSCLRIKLARPGMAIS